MINAPTLIITVGLFLHVCWFASLGVSSSSVGVAKTGRDLFTHSLRHFVVSTIIFIDAIIIIVITIANMLAAPTIALLCCHHFACPRE